LGVEETEAGVNGLGGNGVHVGIAGNGVACTSCWSARGDVRLFSSCTMSEGTFFSTVADFEREFEPRFKFSLPNDPEPKDRCILLIARYPRLDIRRRAFLQYVLAW